MARIDTLTAYNCKFTYLQRNNPMLEEQREAIKKGETPGLDLSTFLELYSEYTKSLAVGINSDRAIMMVKEQITPFSFMESNCWHLIPNSGKQGRPVTVMKPSIGKRYDFNSDSAALYDHHIFCYEKDNHIVMVFHRQNGSGCKSVFLETANNVLKKQGIKLEMDVIVPCADELTSAEPIKLTLQYTEKKLSTDRAENIDGPKKKKRVIRDMGINLESAENSKIKKIFDAYKLGHLPKDVAFVQIKAEIANSTDYDTAEIRLKVGKHTKTYSWNEIENIYGHHDITDELHSNIAKAGDFTGALKISANEYYRQILLSGVLDNG